MQTWHTHRLHIAVKYNGIKGHKNFPRRSGSSAVTNIIR